MIASDADPYDLARFIAAQEPAIDRVRAELRAGRKVSHWMWFVFPQLAGLGRSETARFYATDRARKLWRILRIRCLDRDWSNAPG
jgi:uncharacterized protein (DUF1810 family)